MQRQSFFARKCALYWPKLHACVVNIRREWEARSPVAQNHHFRFPFPTWHHSQRTLTRARHRRKSQPRPSGGERRKRLDRRGHEKMRSEQNCGGRRKRKRSGWPKRHRRSAPCGSARLWRRRTTPWPTSSSAPPASPAVGPCPPSLSLPLPPPWAQAR